MEYAGTLYDSEEDASIANATDFLTAGGLNSMKEAREYWEEGADVNMDEAKEHGFKVIGDWNDVWDDVAEELDFYEEEGL